MAKIIFILNLTLPFQLGTLVYLFFFTLKDEIVLKMARAQLFIIVFSSAFLIIGLILWNAIILLIGIIELGLCYLFGLFFGCFLYRRMEILHLASRINKI